MKKGILQYGIYIRLLGRKFVLYKLYSEIPWEKLHGKRILITGASGMIGSALILMIMKLFKKR